MKIRLIGLLLAAVMLLPLLSSCMSEPPLEEVAAPIYTLYTIADATPEAIREVELALNRIIFFRIGVCIDIVAVPEDEYDELIENQFKVMEEYTAQRRSNQKAASSENNDNEESVVMTGERIIELLENGEDIPRENPRLDIFLVRSYEEYFRLATTGKLTAIDDKLSSEAKLINDYLHSTLFSAAKINNRTYGVPVNNTIGKYKYIVFDKELLEKYEIDAKTMKSIEDLEEYLEVIKQNEPGVVPLKKAMDSAEYSFMFQDGFATYVSSNGVVESTYEDEKILSYYAMISRYNALGYFDVANPEASEEESEAESIDRESARFAVSFVSGNQTDLDALSSETGYEYDYNIYQMPMATNQNTIENIYAISKFCVSNEVTDVMRLLTQIYTDTEVQNTLTYGAVGTHYIINDDNQVKRLNSDYIINPNYTGNKFITTTLEGENPNKWDSAKKQNLDSVASKMLGFDLVPAGFDYVDDEGVTQTLYEPHYIEIIQSIIDRYYPSIINGTIVDLDIDALKAETAEIVHELLKEQLIDSYRTKITTDFSAAEREKILNSSEADIIWQRASDNLWEQVLSRVRRTLTARLTTQFREELGPEATNDEIQEKVQETLTEDYVWEYRFIEYSEEEIDELIEAQFQNEIAGLVDTRVSEYLESSSYQNEINKKINSAEFTQELESNFDKYGFDLINEKVDETIAGIIMEASAQMIEEFNIELEAAVTEFVEQSHELLDLTEEEMQIKLGYLKEVKDEDDKVTIESPYSSYFEFVLVEKIQKQYYSVYPLPEA